MHAFFQASTLTISLAFLDQLLSTCSDMNQIFLNKRLHIFPKLTWFICFINHPRAVVSIVDDVKLNVADAMSRDLWLRLCGVVAETVIQPTNHFHFRFGKSSDLCLNPESGKQSFWQLKSNPKHHRAHHQLDQKHTFYSLTSTGCLVSFKPQELEVSEHVVFPELVSIVLVFFREL